MNDIEKEDDCPKPETPELIPNQTAVKETNSLPSFILNYFEITRKLVFSPFIFFNQMDRSGSLTEPVKFLAVSAIGNGILSFLFSGFNFGLIFRNSIFVVFACFIISALTFGMAKSMGGKCSFAVAFRVFAYCSCFSIIAAIPGIGFLAPIAGLTLNFIGLNQVLGANLYQTISIMFLVSFMQVLLTLGQMLGH